jgi:hypothetical protein
MAGGPVARTIVLDLPGAAKLLPELHSDLSERADCPARSCCSWVGELDVHPNSPQATTV